MLVTGSKGSARESGGAVGGAAVLSIPQVRLSPTEVSKRFTSDRAFGPVDAYAVDPFGQPISQRVFVECYVAAATRLINEAQGLLGSTNPRSAIAAATGGLPSPESRNREQWSSCAERNLLRQQLGAHSEEQGSYEWRIRTEIVRLSRIPPGQKDSEIAFRAACLASSVLDSVEREARLTRLSDTPGNVLSLQRELMAAARQFASEKGGGVEDILEGFIVNCQTRGLSTPKLMVLSDFDGNLTWEAHQGSPHKPGELTNKLLDAAEPLMGLERDYRLRLVLTECAGLSAEMEELRERCFENVHAQNRLFGDVRAFCETLSAQGAHHEVLTANHRDVPRFSLRALGVTGVSVRGLSASSFFFEKVSPILDFLAADGSPKIVVVSDDDEGSLARHIASGRDAVSQIPPPLHWYLPDLVFFSSREGAVPAGRTVRVAGALRDSGVPFISNRIEDAGTRGLDGLTRFVDRYRSLVLGS